MNENNASIQNRVRIALYFLRFFLKLSHKILLLVFHKKPEVDWVDSPSFLKLLKQ